ncbi:MAG: repeat-containing protein [Gemmataceae bacterium]|nr:repeat-containing protein [Gemmataceae bacterium]
MNQINPTLAGKWMLGSGRRNVGWAVFASAVLTISCRGSGPAPLRDEGKSVDELRAMLAAPDPEVQARGAFGLSRHGPAAKDAVPDLIPKLKESDPLVRQNAALALGAVGPEATAAVPALTAALADPEWTVRRQSAVALGAIGREAKPALPALRKLDSDPHKLVRDAAKQAREKLGG